jgi:hypothetical protein
MTRLASVVVLIALIALLGCSDWDNPAKNVAREMQRIGYGCQDFKSVDAHALAPRGITAAGSCTINGVLVTISVFKNQAALETDRAASAARCRAAPQPSRAFQANPYVRTGRSIIERDFTDVSKSPPDVVAAFWSPMASDIASATHGVVEIPNC